MIEPKSRKWIRRLRLSQGRIGYRRGGVPPLAEHEFLVAVCDIDRDKAETVARSIGGLGIECDVASPQSVQSAASRCKAELGTPDFAHLNAGIMTSPPGEPYQPIETVPLDAYRKIMALILIEYSTASKPLCRP